MLGFVEWLHARQRRQRAAVAAGTPTWYNGAIRNTDRKTVNALLSLLSLPGYVRIGPGRSFSILNIEEPKS